MSSGQIAGQEVFRDPDGPVDAAREVHLAEYWEVVRKRWRLVVVAAAACVIGSFITAFLAVPLYRSTVTIDVEKERANPFDTGQGMFVYDWYQPEYLPTQMRLMRSRDLAIRVARRLNLAGNPEFNPPVRRGKALTADEAAELFAGMVQGGIEVGQVRGTNLVELSYVAKSPKLAADVANAVAEAYIDWTTESKFKMVGQASQFLERQIEQIKGEVDDAERNLQMYGRSKDIVSMDTGANVTLQKLETLNKDYAAAVGDRISKEARYYELQSSKAESVADSVSNGMITNLRGEQMKLEREYAEKLNLFKPEWPAMQQLKAQIVKGRQHLETAIEETVTKAREQAKSEYQTALRKEESLKEVLKTQKTEAMALNSNAVEYNNLKVEVATKRTLLDTLLKRQSETEISARLAGSRESNIRVVDRALPPGARFRPSYRRNVSMGLMLGMALGLGLAFFLEYLDRTIRNPEQVERHLGLPSLGLIPAIGGDESGRYGYYRYGYGRRRRKPTETKPGEKMSIELLPHHFPRSVGSEAYRAFRAALLLSRAGGVKCFVITSGLAGEGKTSTAVNLAIVLGQLGKRTLLVDADLHKPRLHKVLKLSNRQGLVSVLAESVEPAKAIQGTNIPFLWCLTSGPNSPNPSGLLASEAMSRLLELAQQHYDYVVIDSPPVQPVADALLLGVQTDGVVLTVKGGKTARDQVARVRDKLLRANVRILGVLINNLAEDASDYVGRRYYYYGSESGYGYGEEPQKPSGTVPKTAQGSPLAGH